MLLRELPSLRTAAVRTQGDNSQNARCAKQAVGHDVGGKGCHNRQRDLCTGLTQHSAAGHIISISIGRQQHIQA